MKKYIIIAFFLFLAAMIVLPFTSIGMSDPIKVSVTTEDGTEFPIEIGMFCAESFLFKQCEFLDENTDIPPESVNVSSGEVITFNLAESPNELQVQRMDIEGNFTDGRDYMDDEKREIIVPQEKGIHVYVLEGEWDKYDMKTEYKFSINVE